MFILDPAFERTSAALAGLVLCEARLQLDARFPWIILIPRVAAAGGLEDVAAADHARLVGEILRAGAAVRAVGEAIGAPVARLNVGMLGNITAQLHIHVVGRRPGDAAWPGPVWGHGEAVAYAPEALAAAIATANAVLAAQGL
ncbi:MAG TPA: HIT domain-containing protein [Caulobacteraceae bacterium]|jgi:diadenosine tetraphosphate (Ap4A) HIT family hydrolase|nr:HIT domain-containing protein [Caulobacteraceae bacterium]